MPTKTSFFATLTFTVKFEIDHDECAEVSMDPAKVKDELLAQFGNLPERISGEGLLTYDLPATVDDWNAKVEVQDV